MRKTLTFLLSLILILSTSVAYAADPAKVSYREKSDPDYIFRVKGSNQRFLLLDVSEDKNSKYFIMGIDYYGQMAFDGLGSQRFDTENAMCIAYKLNHSFLTDGFKQSFTDRIYKLPDNVVEHIDFNHVWKTEAGFPGRGADSEYKSTCGIAVLSLEEMYQYQSKIGWTDEIVYGKDSPKSHCWWLRTGRPTTTEMFVVKPEGNKDISGWTVTESTAQIRPVFWVDRDFFAEVAIDLETAGKKIIELYKSNYTAGELKKTYPESEIYDYLNYTPSVQTTVKSISDGNKQISKINGVSTIIAEAEFTNNRAGGESGIAIMTYYDAHGKALKTDSLPMLISAGETRSCTFEIVPDELPKKGEYVKITFVNRSKPFEHNNNSIKYYCE